MWLGEKILTLFSRDPESLPPPTETGTEPDPLSLFAANFAEFRHAIQGKDVLDFGCGTGGLTVGLAEAGAARVVGLDINPRWLRIARERGRNRFPADRVTFVERLEPEHYNRFDVVVSRDSMEHFSDPAACLQLIRDCCRPEGCVFITFGPPWFSPHGSHMNFFTPMPWVNLLFSERTVMKVRGRYRSDGARRYEEVESGLNRMSIARFERLIAASRLDVRHLEYHCVKRWHWLGRLPLLRELFINEVACVLRPAAPKETASDLRAERRCLPSLPDST